MDLDGVHFDQTDRILLQACRDNGGEIQLILCRQGVDDEDVCALERHAQTMVKRGYLERLLISGTRSKMQGAALYVTFRARPVALALLDILEKGEALERELAALRPPQPAPAGRRRASRAKAAGSPEPSRP